MSEVIPGGKIASLDFSRPMTIQPAELVVGFASSHSFTVNGGGGYEFFRVKLSPIPLDLLGLNSLEAAF